MGVTVIEKARTQLILGQPWFGSLLFKLEFIKTTDVDVAATDGSHLYYNPEGFAEFDEIYHASILAHEALHCILYHPYRRNERDPKAWNVACDYAVNSILVQEGFPLPESALYEPKYANETAENIYDDLLENAQEVPLIFGADVMDAALSDAETTQAEAEWKIAVQQATKAAKNMGKLSNNLEALVEGLLEPVIDWKDALARFVTEKTKGDYTWSRPNRRFIGDDIYLPSNTTFSIGEMSIIVDTSGSVSNSELQEFISEVNGILDVAAPSKVNVIYADTEVNNEQIFTPSDYPITAEVKGRGGTDFRPALSFVTKHRANSACIIYFTDMEGVFPDEAPPIPVLWLSNSHIKTAPFGDVVTMH